MERFLGFRDNPGERLRSITGFVFTISTFEKDYIMDNPTETTEIASQVLRDLETAETEPAGPAINKGGETKPMPNQEVMQPKPQEAIRFLEYLTGSEDLADWPYMCCLPPKAVKHPSEQQDANSRHALSIGARLLASSNLFQVGYEASGSPNVAHLTAKAYESKENFASAIVIAKTAKWNFHFLINKTVKSAAKGVTIHGKKSIAGADFVYVDVDAGFWNDKTRLTTEFETWADVPKPSIIWSSGNGHWVMYKMDKTLDFKPGAAEDPVRDEVYANVLQKMRALFGGDKHAETVHRLSRLPGTINWNNPDGEPKLAELLELNDNIYSLNDFDTWDTSGTKWRDEAKRLGIADTDGKASANNKTADQPDQYPSITAGSKYTPISFGPSEAYAPNAERLKSLIDREELKPYFSPKFETPGMHEISGARSARVWKAIHAYIDCLGDEADEEELVALMQSDLIHTDLLDHTSKWAGGSDRFLRTQYRKAVDAKADDPVVKLNSEYFASMVGDLKSSEFRILEEEIDNDGVLRVRSMTKDAFLQKFENVKSSYKNGRGGFLSIAQAWLKWPGRRSYRRVVFEPDPANMNPEDYNLFQGFNGEITEGECSTVRYHMKQVLCSGNEEHYEVLKRIIGYKVANPGKKCDIILSFVAQEGTGKSVLMKVLQQYFAKAALVIPTMDQLVVDANAELSEALVVGIDELCKLSRRDAKKVDAMCTMDTLKVKILYRDKFEIPNRMLLIGNFTRESAPLISETGRRFIIIESSGHKVGEDDYFDALFAAIPEESKHWLYECLQAYQAVENYHPRKDVRSISSTLKNSLRIQSLPPIEALFHDCMAEAAEMPMSVVMSCNEDNSLNIQLPNLVEEINNKFSKTSSTRVTPTDVKSFIKMSLKAERNREKEKEVGQRGIWRIPPLPECRKLWQTNLFKSPDIQEELDNEPDQPWVNVTEPRPETPE